METIEKFLEFNGKEIIFVSVEGRYWIALKPLCEALHVDYRRTYGNAKTDPILGDQLAEHTLQVGKEGNRQRRKMTCIPEQFVYGWLFSLRSDSDQLINYKRRCYDLLYNHFHGTITNRKEILIKRRAIEDELADIQSTLSENSTEFRRIKELETAKRQLNSQLGVMDKEIIKQPELFKSP